MIDLALTITCDLCGHVQDTPLSQVIAQPAIECTAGCGRVILVPQATIRAILQRYSGEVFDLSLWKPRRVRLAARMRRARTA